MKMKWTVDSIEEGIAAVESAGKMHHVPISLLPTDVKEGDVLAVEISVDAAATREAFERSAKQVGGKPDGRDPGGDIRL